jgi:thiosulfate/3-mercaptopyruvate sulfurtransferase
MFAHVVLAVLLPGAAGEGNKPAAYPQPKLLLEVADLARPETARSFLVLDARPKPKYRAGHVPGAVWVDHATWSRAFAAGPDKDAWAKRLGELGIDPATRVVVYDEDTKDAARIWWILRYWGVKDARLLNGGWRAWQAVGGKVEKGEVKPAAKTAALAPQPDRLATKAQLLEGLKARKQQIIDARSAEEHCGMVTTEKRGGSIPGAVHLEWVEVLDPKTHRFKAPDELTRLFKEAGIDPARPSVTYCQSGGRAAVMAFTLELMGGRDVRNYYRSWAEWANAEDTPVEKPKPKK